MNDSTAELQQLLDVASGGDQSAYADLVGRSRDRLEQLARKMLRAVASVHLNGAGGLGTQYASLLAAFIFPHGGVIFQG